MYSGSSHSDTRFSSLPQSVSLAYFLICTVPPYPSHWLPIPMSKYSRSNEPFTETSVILSHPPEPEKQRQSTSIPSKVTETTSSIGHAETSFTLPLDN